MTELHSKRFRIEGIPELWISPGGSSAGLLYRPAVLLECTLNFRSIRAGLNHSEDRSFTAWLPESELAIDWDSPAVEIQEGVRLEFGPDPSIGYLDRNYDAAKDTIKQYHDELLEKLIRHERLKVFYSPVFGLYSAPDDPLENFLAQTADAALRKVEPELKQLRRRFELQLEQIREAQERRGLKQEGLGLDRLQIQNIQLAESENRLASIFSTLAGTVFGTPEPRHADEEDGDAFAELEQDLDRMEQEASDALRALYDEYMTIANDYDTFEIGLQAENIQVLRVALLWVPVEAN